MSQQYARGLLVTPLDEDGRPLFTVDGDEVTFHREGWYRLTAGEMEHELNVFAGAKVRHVSFVEDAQVSKRDDDLRLLLTDLVDEEPCRLDHDGDCQEHGWSPGLADRRCPQERLRDHLGLDRQVNDDVEEPSAEALTAVRHGIALSWLQQGTLDLPALAAAIGMDVDQGVLRVRPTEQAKITGPHGSWDTRTVEIPSHTRTQVVGPDGDLPAVWVQQYSGRNVRIKVDRSHGLRGAVNTEVWVYHSSDTAGPQDAVSLGSANRVLREATQAQAKIIQEHIDRANELRDRLARIGRYLHVQANRLHVTAQGMTAEAQADGNEFYVMCDVLAKLRETAADVCGVPYDETEKLDPNEGVPWSLRQWALLARQTLEQQALQLADALKYIQESTGWLSSSIGVRVPAHAVDLMRQVVAEYPEDVDAVQAEQATRNADDEAVRRLAHAMTEVANQLEARWSTMRMFVADGDAFVIPYAVDKLRRTVREWTTEEQRRPWAAAMSGEPEAVMHCQHYAWWHGGSGCQIAGCRCARRRDTFGEDQLDGQLCRTVPLGSQLDPVDGLPDQEAPNPWDLSSLASLRVMRGPIEFKIQREVPIEVVERLARTMQSVASGIEAAYRPGGPPWGIGQAIEALRSESAPWTSDALRAHDGEPADPEDTSADLKNTEALQGPHGAGGSERVPSQVIVALRDAKALLETMRGQETPSLILWARAARIRLAEALKLVES